MARRTHSVPNPLVHLGVLTVLALAGCKGGAGEAVYTEDHRIDGAEDDPNDPDSFGTKMCVAEDGASTTIYVLFMDNRSQPDEERYDLWLNRSVNLGQDWLPAPIKVNHSESHVWNPDLYCNDDGVYVVWEDDRDGILENHQIYFNASTDKGETFLDEDILLEDDPEGDTMSLEPKIRGIGKKLFVVWYDSLNGAYDILVNRSTNGGNRWQDPVRVDSDTTGESYSARPQMAIGGGGDDVWVVWEDSRNGSADIYFARSTDGGESFDPDERLDGGDARGANNSFEPQLCADPGGDLYAVWHDARNGDGNDIFMNYSGNAGGRWLDDAVRLDTDAPGLGNSLFPVCAVSGTTLHVAWHDQRQPDYGYDIFYRRADAGEPGAPEIRLDAGTTEGYANSVEPRIVESGGTVLVAWRDNRGEIEAGTENNYDDLYYNYAQAGASFDAESDYRIDSMYDGKSYKVDLNVGVVGGSWYAAWTDGRAGTSDIYFQTFPLGEEAKPPPFEGDAP